MLPRFIAFCVAFPLSSMVKQTGMCTCACYGEDREHCVQGELRGKEQAITIRGSNRHRSTHMHDCYMWPSQSTFCSEFSGQSWLYYGINTSRRATSQTGSHMKVNQLYCYSTKSNCRALHAPCRYTTNNRFNNTKTTSSPAKSPEDIPAECR